MASLLRRALSILPRSRFLPFRYAASAAVSPHLQKKSEQKQKSPDVPCQTRKLESSSSPCSMRNPDAAINISKAVDSAVKRLQQESEHPIREDDLSVEIIDGPDSTYTLEIKAPAETIKADIRIDDGRWDGSYLNVYIKRKDRYYFEFDGSHFCCKGDWDIWIDHFNCSEDIEPQTQEAEDLMLGQPTMHLENILAKRGIKLPVNEWLTAYVDNKHRTAAQLTWMESVKDFVQN